MRKEMRSAIAMVGLLALLDAGALGSLAGQEVGSGFQSWEPVVVEFTGSFSPDASDSGSLPRRDYRYEGTAFGGIVLGTAGAWVGWNVAMGCPTMPGARCEPDRLGNAIAVGLVGAAVGSGLGYVVGRLSSKPYPNQSLAADSSGIRIAQNSVTAIPESTRRVAGYQHWKGAAIGGTAGALLGALLGARARTGCSDCDMDDGDVVKATLVTAGIGGAFGFLIGLASPKDESP
jgi:hypothetical protein